MSEVLDALVYKYGNATAENGNVDTDVLSIFLNSLDSPSDNTSLKSLVSTNKPEWVLSTTQRAILGCIDDCTKLIFSIADVDSEIEIKLRSTLPKLCTHILANPELPLCTPPTLITVLDELNGASVGWIPELGASGSRLKQKLDDVVDKIVNSDSKIDALAKDLSIFIDKEKNRTSKQEQRLAASETGLVRAQLSKSLAADMINLASKGRLLTETLLDFLQGPWYDSAQLIITNDGVESETWHRAEKITETLIKTYQPIDVSRDDANKAQQYLYRIIEHLPNEIRELLVALAHNTEAIENALKMIESDHVTIVSGQKLDYVEFNEIPTEGKLTAKSRTSKFLLKKVNRLKPGEWFAIEHDEEDTDEDSNAVQRIKLVLKLDDIKQLLFTNRNGMKVLQKSFDEFAYDLASHRIRSLNHEAVFSSTFRTYYNGLLEEHKRHQKVIEERKQDVAALDEARKLAREKALKEAKQIALQKTETIRVRQIAEKEARLAAAKIEAGKAENADLVTQYHATVLALNTGAQLTLPDKSGEMSKCKLAVKISSADKMIFVTSSGLRAGEYNTEQLVQLLLIGDAVILDEGIEFEDTLAQVVSKLRHDRNKSYDDLTGE